MFPLLVVAICVCAAVTFFPNLMTFINGDTDEKIYAGINMAPLLLAIVAMSIALTRV